MHERSKLSLEAVWIRVRGWASLVSQTASIGLFLLGVWALYTLFTSPAFEIYGGEFSTTDILALEEPVAFLGRDVPGLVGTPMETLFVFGMAMMIGGLALSFRLLGGRSSPAMGY